VFYLFVCVDSHKEGILPTIKRFFWETLPNGIKKLAKKVCGERFL
jgi:hypothetical protein